MNKNSKEDYLSIDESLVESFSCVEKNEKETALVLKSNRELMDDEENPPLIHSFDEFSKKRIHYISDIHLMHKIVTAKTKNQTDIKKCVDRIVDDIICNIQEILLIGGDVASDFSVFVFFIRTLRRKIDALYPYLNPKVIFVLGNHELWSFPGESLD